MDVCFIILFVFLLVGAIALARAYCMKAWKAKLKEDIEKYDDAELQMLYEFHKSLTEMSYFRYEPLWYSVFVLLEDEMNKRLLIK